MPPSSFSYTSAEGAQIAAYRWTRAEIIAELSGWLDRVVTARPA